MITIFIPAFNEETRLGATIETILSASKMSQTAIEIVVVNDGSTDGTGALAQRLAADHDCIRVIDQPTNRGLGAGFRAALAIAKHPKFLLVPGDNDVSVEMLSQLMALHDSADMVCAYFLNREDRGRRRNVLSIFYNVIYMVSFNTFIQYVTGPAVYPTDTLRKIGLRSERFSIISEATIKTLRTGCTFCEVGGYAQTGLQGSTSLSLRNFTEVITGYLRLFSEVHIQRKQQFGHKPRRVRISLAYLEQKRPAAAAPDRVTQPS